MGTNYYWRPIITEEQREEILDRTKYASSIEDIKNYISERFPNTEVHIGKQSAGWQFLFCLVIKEYTELTYDAIIDWLNSGLIYDEYGQQVSTNDFLIVVSNHRFDLTYKEYYKLHPDEPVKYKAEDQIINNLRFTTDDREFC